MLKKYLKFYVFGKTKVLSGAPVINVKYFLLVFLKIWIEIYPLWHTGYHYDIVAHMKEFNKKLNRNGYLSSTIFSKTLQFFFKQLLND